jgi:acetone carboxylase gamma subunit
LIREARRGLWNLSTPGRGRSRAADPAWTVLREFSCPGCAAQLDVEVVPRGYPFVFNFVPDIDSYERRTKPS